VEYSRLYVHRLLPSFSCKNSTHRRWPSLPSRQDASQTSAVTTACATSRPSMPRWKDLASGGLVHAGRPTTDRSAVQRSISDSVRRHRLSTYRSGTARERKLRRVDPPAAQSGDWLLAEAFPPAHAAQFALRSDHDRFETRTRPEPTALSSRRPRGDRLHGSACGQRATHRRRQSRPSHEFRISRRRLAGARRKRRLRASQEARTLTRDGKGTRRPERGRPTGSRVPGASFFCWLGMGFAAQVQPLAFENPILRASVKPHQMHAFGVTAPRSCQSHHQFPTGARHDSKNLERPVHSRTIGRL